MESIVVSLEVAKQLKAAGWEHETAAALLASHRNDGTWSLHISKQLYNSRVIKQDRILPAPTASEIADQIPRGLDLVHYPDDAGKWCATRGTSSVTDADTMADALALLWIALNKESNHE